MADPKDFSITVCDLPTHEQLVAEIFYKEQFVGLISEEEGPAARRFELASANGADAAPMSLEDFLQAIAEASSRLDSLGWPPRAR